jgi:hypothetical protein
VPLAGAIKNAATIAVASKSSNRRAVRAGADGAEDKNIAFCDMSPLGG